MGTVKNTSIYFIKQVLLSVLFVFFCINFLKAAPIKYSDSLNAVKLRVIKTSGTSDSSEVNLRWGPGGYCLNPTDTYDSDCDAIYMGKSGLDIAALDTKGQYYSTFNGSALSSAATEKRSVAINVFYMSANSSYKFRLQVSSAFKDNNIAYLYDQFTDTYTRIDDGSDIVSHVNFYNFTTTSDTASTSINRFYLVFNLSNTRTWVGKTSNSWNTKTNWYPISVPAANNNIIVDTGAYTLLLDQNRTIKNLTFNNSALLKLNGYTLTLQGTIAGTGYISSTSTSNMIINGTGSLGTIYFDQTSIGTTNVLNNFTINRTATGTVTLGNAVIINNVLDIASTSSLEINGNTLSLVGTVTGTGTLTGSSNSNLSITGTGSFGTIYFNQAKPDTTNIINNFTLNRSSSGTATLGNTMVLLGTYTPTAGVLTTGGNLVLRSTAVSDASILAGSASGGYLSGNVTVERYLGSSFQWRMVGFPFLKTWNINGVTLKTFYNTGKYYANSYDESKDNGSYGNSGLNNLGWVSLDGATPNVLAYKGIVMVGGPATKIKLTGPLNTGTQNIPLQYTASNTNKGWNLVANPFPCNIDWDEVIKANINAKISKAIYRWDPESLGYAAYVNNNSTGNQSNIVENGASVFILSTGDTTLIITEACKSSAAPQGRLFATPSTGDNATLLRQSLLENTHQSIVKLYLRKLGDVVADQAIIRWGNADKVTDVFDEQYDALDLGRKAGPDLAILDANLTAYAIFHGTALKSPIEEGRSIQLQTSGLIEGETYQIKMDVLSELANNNAAYLFDKYTREYTKIEKDKEYSFTIKEDSLSKSEHRLMLVFNKKENTANEVVFNQAAIRLIQNPIIGNNIQLVSIADYTKVSWQLVDQVGRIMSVGNVNNVKANQTFQISAASLPKSNQLYFLQLRADDKLLPALKLIK